MTTALRFDPIRLPQHCQELRREVRAFLAHEISAGTFNPQIPGSASARQRQGIQPTRRAAGLDRNDLAEAVWRPGAQLS
jgi:hypothetical protein